MDLEYSFEFQDKRTGTNKIGWFCKIRIQISGNLDPDNNGREDSLLNRRAMLFEAGLLVNVKLTEKLNLSSGVLLTAALEVTPTNFSGSLF